jgi:hypothetical protein
MDNTNKIINDLLKTIDNSTNEFNDKLPDIQKKAFSKIIEIATQLDKKADGSIKITVRNIKILNRIKTEIDNVIYSKDYQKSLNDFTKAFDKIAALQQSYFSNVSDKFSPGTLFNEVKMQSINSVVDQLGRDGLSTNISSKVRDILRQNITTGGKFYDLVDQLKTFMTDTKGSDGSLTRYAKTITTDALNQYSATYDALATDDLGLEWYEYTGSLRKTSRDFCKAMIEAKGEGMKFIHRSQFDTIIHGNINGQRLEINEKTGLPYGMREETTESNFQILRGGYSCNHLLKPVMTELVPKSLRDKFS